MRLVLSTSVGAWLTTWAPGAQLTEHDWNTSHVVTVPHIKPAGHYTLNLLSYNVFLRPQVVDAMFGFKDLAECRAAPLARALSASAFDVVALQEAQHPIAMPRLLDGLKKTYGFHIEGEPSAFAWADSRPVNGGNAVFSRYPIEHWYSEPYRYCSGEDCLARKGFVHTLVRLAPDLKVNVIGTHLNSGNSALARTIRHKQFSQLRDYITQSNRFDPWPIVVLGDLNVDGGFYSDRLEYRAMLKQLSLQDRGPPVDPFFESMKRAGSDIAIANSRNCTSSRVVPCKSPNDEKFREERRRVDYVLYWPSATYDVEVESLQMLDYPDKECGTRYLSDHQAPAARLIFHK